jgi:hypothetical protein
MGMVMVMVTVMEMEERRRMGLGVDLITYCIRFVPVKVVLA